MVEYVCQRERFCAAGTELLRCRITVPRIEGKDAINKFYGELARRVYRFCKTDLLKRATEAFENDTDPKKHFRFSAYFYILECQVTCETEELLSVRMESKLGRRGGAPLLKYANDAHTWRLREETLLPPRQIVEELSARPMPKGLQKKIKGILISDEKLILCVDNSWEEWEIIKNA